MRTLMHIKPSIELGKFYTLFSSENPTTISRNGKITRPNKVIFWATEWDEDEPDWLWCKIKDNQSIGIKSRGEYLCFDWESILTEIRESTPSEINQLLHHWN